MYRQRGSLLIELSVVLVLVLVLGIGSVSLLKERAEQQRVENMAVWMLRLQQGVQFFLDTNADELAQNQSPNLVGINQIFEPTVTELQQLGFLPSSFSLSYLTSIVLYREGDCPGIRCHVHAVIASHQPFLRENGAVNQDALSQWQLSTAAKGFVVTAARPQWLSGADRQIPNTNAVFETPLEAGTVALTASTDPSLFGFVRQADTRNPHFKTDVDIEGSLRAEADLVSGKHLFFARTESKGSRCNNLDALAKGNNEFLICKNGIWSSFGAVSPSLTNVGGFYTRSVSRGNCNTGVSPLNNALNPVTKSCGCPNGYTPYPITYTLNDVIYGGHMVTYVCLNF